MGSVLLLGIGAGYDCSAEC